MITPCTIYHPLGEYDDLKTINGVEFTSEEIDVIICVLNGRTEPEIIASFLTTPSKTFSSTIIETHLHTIIQKLGNNFQEDILNFIEKSSKQSLVLKHYEYLQAKANSFSFSLGDIIKSKKYWIIFFIIFCVSFLCLVNWLLRDNKAIEVDQNPLKGRINYLNKQSILSDLLVPSETILLHRPQLSAQLKEKLKGSHRIQTVALLGMEGAGKTTLARLYAQKQKTNFAWEVNAETWLTLTHSFEKMAFALCQTDREHKSLRKLQSIQNIATREEKILSFVKGKLKAYANWLLIYDNVGKAIDIQKYIPCETTSWGNGKVILTIQGSNIQQNRYTHHTIFVSELSPSEKLDLFMKVMRQLPVSTPPSHVEIKKILEIIPPFPLDVLMAAYYLKETGVSHTKYREALEKQSEQFANPPKTLTKDAGHFTKIRASIIALSLEEVIKSDQEYIELLLLISLVNSQNIPRNLLEICKYSTLIDNFIGYLKRYFLLTNESLYFPSLTPSLSVHCSVQETCLYYLIKKFDLAKNKKLLQEVSQTLEKYTNSAIERENIPLMKLLINHCEGFLKHRDLLTHTIKGSLKAQVGLLNFYLDRHREAQPLLEESLQELTISSENPFQIANVTLHLGFCDREIGNYKKSKELLEKVLEFYQKHPNSSDSHVKIIQTLAYLGIVYRELGYYEEAKDMFEKSFTYCRKYIPEGHRELARILGFLAIIYRELGNYNKTKELIEQVNKINKKYPDSPARTLISLASTGIFYKKIGNYEKAKDLLEESLLFYKQHFSGERYKGSYEGRILIHLGDTYRNLGNYKKSKELLEKGIDLYKNYFPEKKNMIGRPLAYLGNVYRMLGNFETAMKHLEKALAIYEQHYGKDHIETAKVLGMIAQVYLAQNDLGSAERHLGRALKIFHKTNHSEIYFILEVLAELSLKKSENSKENTQQSQALKKQAFDYLTQAHFTLQTHFPKESPHLARIQAKLASLG